MNTPKANHPSIAKEEITDNYSIVTPLFKIFENPAYRGKRTITEIPTLAMTASVLVWLSILSLIPI